MLPAVDRATVTSVRSRLTLSRSAAVTVTPVGPPSSDTAKRFKESTMSSASSSTIVTAGWPGLLTETTPVRV